MRRIPALSRSRSLRLVAHSDFELQDMPTPAGWEKKQDPKVCINACVRGKKMNPRTERHGKSHVDVTFSVLLLRVLSSG